MARLIDADALKKALRNCQIESLIAHTEEKNVFDIIDEQPAAYDVDGVVDELWDEQLDARQLMNEGKEWGAGCYSGLQIAIETIRKFEKAGDNNENNN